MSAASSSSPLACNLFILFYEIIGLLWSGGMSRALRESCWTILAFGKFASWPAPLKPHCKYHSVVVVTR
jgi:hypothetical protein